jgi:glycerol-3-phosphate cytidylyltransferase-like family protein
MSAQIVEEILRRAQTDETFRDQLQHRPDAALHGYDIEYDERQALISGDAARLRELGVNADLALMADAYNPTRQEPTQ